MRRCATVELVIGIKKKLRFVLPHRNRITELEPVRKVEHSQYITICGFPADSVNAPFNGIAVRPLKIGSVEIIVKRTVVQVYFIQLFYMST